MIKDYRQFDLLNKKVFEKVVLQPPFRFQTSMPDDACFYYLVGGSASVITPTESFVTETEEGVVLKCGNYLNDYLSSVNHEFCEAIAIHFYPEVLKMIYEKEFPDFLMEVTQMEPARYDHVKASALMKQYIDSLQFYFDNPALVNDELLKLKLKELILLLAKTDNVDTVKSLINGMFSRAELNLKEIVEANVYQTVSLEELAFLCSLSLSSFKREFLKYYDCPPATYLRRRKMEKAAKLLKGTSLRVTDIAFDCGFNDLAHFSKVFQKEYGISPSEYKLDGIAK